MKTLKIEITAEDIANAEKDKSGSICQTCPTHQALRRYLKRTKYMQVGFHFINYGPQQTCVGELGAKLSDQIWLYPKTPFKPGTYTLKVEERFLRKEYK